MRTFKEFCNICECNISRSSVEEFWNPFTKKESPKQIKKEVPKDVKVLAYKDYKPGVLNKTTGKFTQRLHSPDEAKRYGWKPVETSSYGPKDTPSSSSNTGKDKIQRTADGTEFTGSTKGLAVPYKYKKNEVPKGVWAGTPSIPFGSKIDLTQKPLGKNTKTVTSTVKDTGNFGSAGDYNKSTSFDLMRQTARDLTNNPNLTPTQYGKRKIYVRNSK